MDGYGVQTYTAARGSARYRAGDVDRWDSISEAAGVAASLLPRGRTAYVTVGNGEHELRMWRDDAEAFGSLSDTPTGPRWAEWFVDVEIDGRRWQYRPLADLSEFDEADELAEAAAGLASEGVTRVWVGRSDGSECQDWEVSD